VEVNVSKRNPAAPATTYNKHAKIVLWGPTGGGKTPAGLMFHKAGRLMVADPEHGSDWYAGQVPFDATYPQTLQELNEAIDFLEEDAGRSYEVFMLDSCTPIYTEYAAQIEKRVGNNPRDIYSVVNREMEKLWNRLVHLPLHVVVTARESALYKMEGKQMTKVGDKPDIDKAMPYSFDTNLHMMVDSISGIHRTRVIRVRGYRLPWDSKDLPWPLIPWKFDEDGMLRSVDWEMFEPIVAKGASGVQSNEQPATKPAAPAQGLTNQEVAELQQMFRGHAEAAGMKINEFLKAILGPGREWTAGLAAAKDRIAEVALAGQVIGEPE
jgi:hypothetical protein